MKILAFVDLHGSEKAFKKIEKLTKRKNPDIIICAGDISIFENNLDFLIFKLNQLKKPTLFIHGNHESEIISKRLCSEFENMTFIHKKIFKKDNCLFYGYGGGGFSMTDKRFEKSVKKFEKDIKKNKDKKVILVTHAPPYGTKLDLVVEEHCGNKSIANFIKRNKIDLVITGHLHENAKKKDKINSTLMINPGPFGKILKI